MNPVDEFVLRTYVGRCSNAVLDATDTDRVLNGTIHRPGPAWFSADFREQSQRRRDRQRSLYESPSTGAVGFFDIKDFFKSCGHSQLGDLLFDAGAPDGAIMRLTALLGDLFPSGAGLPIGFEGSGPLANLFLMGVDRSILAHGAEFVRWTDDLDVFLRSPDDWPEIRGVVESQVCLVGLQLNEAKVTMLPKGSAAEDKLLDPSRDSIFYGDAVDNAVAGFDAELWERDWSTPTELPAPHFRSRLGVLRSKVHPGAVEYLAETPSWIDQEPRVVGNYLSTLAKDRSARGQLDQDWLLEKSIGRSPSKETAAGQLHMCRVLASYGPDKAAGKRLLEFAFEADVLRRYPALGAWAVRGWAASQGWKRSDFADVVNSAGHASYQRAASAGLRGRSGRDHARLDGVARTHPAVAPALEWATTC